MSISANALYEELLSCGLAESPAASLYLEQALEIFVGQTLDTDEFMAELLAESEWTPEAQVRIRAVLEPYQGEQVFSVSPDSFRSAKDEICACIRQAILADTERWHLTDEQKALLVDDKALLSTWANEYSENDGFSHLLDYVIDDEIHFWKESHPAEHSGAAQIPESPASVVVTIGGSECVCYEYGSTGKMLLEMNGTFGDLSVNCAMLVPMTMTEQTLEELHSLWLTEQEHEHCLPIGESCSSSAWWVGALNAPGAVEISDRYDYLVDLALQDVQFVNLLSGETLTKYGFIHYAWSEAERQFNDCHDNEQWSDLSPADRLEIYRDQFNHLVLDRDWSCNVVSQPAKAPCLDDMIQSAAKRQAAQTVPGVLPEQDIGR